MGDRLAIKSSGTLGWTLPDLHGSMAAVVSATGSSIGDAFRYDAYGETAASTTSALPTPWRYQGNLLLTEPGTSELYENGARAYDPGLGAFTQLDPVVGSAQEPMSLNRYLYAWANPTTLTDPSGHCPGCGVWIDGEVASASTPRPPSHVSHPRPRSSFHDDERQRGRRSENDRRRRQAADDRRRAAAARQARGPRNLDLHGGRAHPGRRPGPADRARAAAAERARVARATAETVEEAAVEAERLSVRARQFPPPHSMSEFFPSQPTSGEEIWARRGDGGGCSEDCVLFLAATAETILAIGAALPTRGQSLVSASGSINRASSGLNRALASLGGLFRSPTSAQTGVSLTLKTKPSWSPAEIAAAQAKVAALNAAAPLTPTTTARSGAAATQWKRTFGPVPQGHDLDHIVDLQLGGRDNLANLAPLLTSPNRSLGAQIHYQLVQLPDGVVICQVTLVSSC